MHILIVAGGKLALSFAGEYCRTLSVDKVFAVDKGLEYTDALKLVPDLILGDFDTVDSGILSRYEKMGSAGLVERYPKKKDASDMELALWRAKEAGADQVTMLAATGSRLDHVVTNMNLLLLAEKAGIECYMVDETNRIQLLSASMRKCVRISREKQYGTYLSVIPMSETVEGFTITGVAYPLDHVVLSQGNSLTVSNQITSENACISLERGSVWIMESRD